MRRLATQIHLTIVAVLALFALLVGAAWWHGPGGRDQQRFVEGLAAAAGELLPAAERPPAELHAELERWHRRFAVDIAVFSTQGERLAWAGSPLTAPGAPATRARWVRASGRGATVALPLPGGRTLVASRPRPDSAHVAGIVATIGLLALAVAVGAWPVVARLTRRLERLRLRVEDLGRGDLGARVAVEGRDEVGDLARSFNRAADRIQQLVERERRQLAFASHELRSPLARLRVSLEMMGGDAELRARAAQDVAELDSLIEELLEASRLEARAGAGRREEVDVLALAAEEGARAGAAVEGQPAVVQGEPRLLRRLVRNLLDNARRHGGAAVRVDVAPVSGGGARLVVSDDGPGVRAEERERVFEPFYRPRGSAESGSGYGLGLALVRQIARAHGGEARCVERPGGGSVFEVILADAKTGPARVRPA